MKDRPSQSVHVRTESASRFSRCMKQKLPQLLRRRESSRRRKSRKEKKNVLRRIARTVTIDVIIVTRDVMTEERTADVTTDAITVTRADVMTDAIIVIRVDAMTDVITVIRVDAMTEEITVDVTTDVIIVTRADVMTDVTTADVTTEEITARAAQSFQSQSWKVRSHREIKEKVRTTLRRKIKTSATMKTV